jgi:hypothetical protein
MKKIKKQEDLKQLQGNAKTTAEEEFAKLQQIADYTSDHDGYALVLEESDTDKDIQKVTGASFENLLWEGVYLRHNCFVGVILFNNQFGLTIIIPDKQWLNVNWRKLLIENLSSEERKPLS